MKTARQLGKKLLPCLVLSFFWCVSAKSFLPPFFVINHLHPPPRHHHLTSGPWCRGRLHLPPGRREPESNYSRDDTKLSDIFHQLKQLTESQKKTVNGAAEHWRRPKTTMCLAQGHFDRWDGRPGTEPEALQSTYKTFSEEMIRSDV